MVSYLSHCQANAFSFFFDFDGTLAELAETPDAVTVDSRVNHVLARLSRETSGAVAIVTGREIDVIDRFLDPLKLAIAGVHGFERRDGLGKRSSASQDFQTHGLEDVLTHLASKTPGLLLEKKRGALALHYRLRPELEGFCLSLAEELVQKLPEAVLMRGKMVIEFRLHRVTKGTAIEDFLKEPPFQGRMPFFAGDDVTDEDAFAVVNDLGGISVKVGPGKTQAKHTVPSVQEFLTWLDALASKPMGNLQHG